MEAPAAGVLDQLLGPDDPEEALSSAALQELAHRAEVRREEVLLTLYANIVERWGGGAGDEEGAAAASSSPGGLEADAAFCASLAGLLDRGLAEEAALAEIVGAAAQHAEACAQLRATLEAAGGIRLTAELQQRLADFEALAAQGAFTEAAWTAVELQKACQALPPADDAPRQVEAAVGPFSEQLQQAVYSLVLVDPATCMPGLITAGAAAGPPGNGGASAVAEAGAWGGADGSAGAQQAAQQAAEQQLGDLYQQAQQGPATDEEGGGEASEAGGGWEAGEGDEGSVAGVGPRSAAVSAPGSEADSLSTAPPAAGSGPLAGASGAAGGEPGLSSVAEGAGGGSAAAAQQQLGEVWAALGVLGLLDGALRTLARFVMERSVAPILASQHDSSLLTDSPAVSIASSCFSRASTLGGGGGGRGEGRSSVERLLYKALRALTEQVLCGNPEYAEQLGAALWPQLSAAYIASQLKPLQPAADTEVEGFSRRSSLGAKLEQKAVKLGLLPAGAEGPITRYIRLTVGRLLAARRNRLVAAAREVLTAPTARETVTAGVPQAQPAGSAAQRSLFEDRGRRQQQQQQQQPVAANGLEGDAAVLATSQYTVSQAAEQVAGLMRSALTEACSSGNAAVAQCMCAVVVDLAGLVASVPAAAAAPAELLLPFPAALRHNDCHYIYQVLMALPHQFSPRLQRLVHRGVSFAAPAARVRKAGDDCLEAMLLRQEEELMGLLDGFEGFSSLDGPGTIRCRKVVMQLLHSFRRLGSVLRGVLPPAVYADVAARLVQAVCGRLIGDVMAMPDISVDESEQIPKILEDFVAGVHESLLGPGPAGGGAAAAAAAAPGGGGRGADAVLAEAALADALQRVLEEKTPAVMKLRELLELLDIRLVEIRRRWGEGRLPALGFSAREVAHVVRALFDHSDLRRDFLHQLEREAADAALL